MTRKKIKLTIRNRGERLLIDDKTISIMELYLTEWIHRDELFWKQLYRLFFSSLTIIILPSIAEKSGWGGVVDYVPPFMFPFAGVLMTFLMLYVGLASSARVVRVSDKYEALIQKLPAKIKLKKRKGAIFTRMMPCITWIFCISLCCLNTMIAPIESWVWWITIEIAFATSVVSAVYHDAPAKIKEWRQRKNQKKNNVNTKNAMNDVEGIKIIVVQNRFRKNNLDTLIINTLKLNGVQEA